MRDFYDTLCTRLKETLLFRRHPIVYIGLCLLLVLTPFGFLGVFWLLNVLETLDKIPKKSD